MLRLKGTVKDDKLVIIDLIEEVEWDIEGYTSYEELVEAIDKQTELREMQELQEYFKELEEGKGIKERKELKGEDNFERYFKTKEELRDWVRNINYSIRILKDYCGLAVGISISGFDFLIAGDYNG